ncbi:hypothetical protein ACO2Q1_00275 [Brevundimonas sp. VNH65]|uniref:hypothetical protein n=1 Tax=Brevundimonas sp. VNH65 TaxID=3400917 RepID=UPI003C08044E
MLLSACAEFGKGFDLGREGPHGLVHHPVVVVQRVAISCPEGMAAQLHRHLMSRAHLEGQSRLDLGLWFDGADESPYLPSGFGICLPAFIL